MELDDDEGILFLQQAAKENTDPADDGQSRPGNGSKAQEKSRKSVRFAEITTLPDETGDCSAAVDGGDTTPMVRIDIPVRFGDNSQANISVNESRLCLTGSLMRTPLPNRTAAAAGASAATPKALRD